MELFILLPLLVLIIWDFRHRYVLLWHLLFFGGIQIGLSIYKFGLSFTGWNMLINTAILLLIGGVLKVYMHFRFKKKEAIGWGDVIFIFLLSPYFTYRAFLYFLIISFSLTLITWFIYTYNRSKDVGNDKIPLISGVGLCYFVLLIYQKINILWS
nr:hypothetical protein [uncultured Bacteroides sp.]